MQKHKTTIIWGVIILAIVGLMFLGGQSSSAGTWEDTNVDCLPSGHQGLAYHIHADLGVFVDDEQQTIPSNTGITNGCMAEVHTHDASGYIHAEVTDASKELSIADFFAVWDRELDRDGYESVITVNGEEVDGDYVFQDGDDMEVRFTSVEDDETATSTDTATSTEDEEATTTDADVEVEAGATTTVGE